MAAKCPLVSDVDFQSITHSTPMKTQGGVGVAFCYARKSKSDRGDVEFQLVKPDPGLMTDATSAQDRDKLLQELPYVRSGFHLQATPTFETNGKHTLLVAVPDDIGEVVKRLDNANVDQVVANAQSWFKRGQLPPDLVKAQYNHLVYRYPDNAEVAESQKATVVRCKIVEGKTQVLVQRSDNYLKFAVGDFHDLSMNARIVPIIKNKGIYFRSTESGGQLTIEKVLVMHGDWKANGQKAFDTGEVQIEIEEAFVPPTSSAPASSAATPGGGGMEIDDTAAATEATVVNGGTWDSGGNGGAAVVF